MGVFLAQDQPAAGTVDVSPAPPRLDFRHTALGTDFLSLSPRIAQSFFIGDGRTDAVQTQRFPVPDRATRFYLGFLDTYDLGWDTHGGLPSAYWDNAGLLTATFQVSSVPEPSSLVLALGAVAIVAGYWRFGTRG
jgi:hypothetical protein